MPFPLIPLVSFAVSGSLVAFGVKAVQKRRDDALKEKNKTFSKYAQDHRVREKTERKLMELKETKSMAQLRELSRFKDIFENILHCGMDWNFIPFEEADYTPFITSAPMRDISALGSAADWAKSGVSELQKQLGLANEELKRIVLHSGFDFNRYSYQDKGIVLRAVNVAANLNKALHVSLVDEKGFRDNSIDEIEELLTETYDRAAA